MSQTIIVKDLIDRQEGNTSRKVTFTFKNKSTGLPKDFSGASAFLQFRSESPTGYVALDLSIGSGLTWTDDSTGILQLDQIDELPLCEGKYYYDVKVLETDLTKLTYAKGKMNVLGLITQSS